MTGYLLTDQAGKTAAVFAHELELLNKEHEDVVVMRELNDETGRDWIWGGYRAPSRLQRQEMHIMSDETQPQGQPAAETPAQEQPATQETPAAEQPKEEGQPSAPSGDLRLQKQEMDRMETNTQTQGRSAQQKLSPDELQKELDKIETPWVKVPKGEAIILRFHLDENKQPIIYKRSQVFKDKKTGQDLPPTDMIDFELEDTMKQGERAGEHKVLSRNMKNSDVQKILDFLKQGKNELMLSADNSGKVSVAAVKR